MIKRLARAVREFKLPSILSPLFMIGEVTMEVIIPVMMAALIDNGIEKENMRYILICGAILIGSCLLSLTCGAMSGRFASIASCGFARNLRHDIYKNVQKFSFANIDKYSPAGIVTRLTTDVTNVQMAYQMIIRIAVRGPVMLVFAMIMSFRVNVELSLVFLCALPILAVGMYLIMSRVHSVFRRVFKTYDRLNNVVEENVRGVRVVKAFVREKHEIKKFNTISDTIYADFTWAEKIIAFNGPLMQFCMYGVMLLISWLGARLIVFGEMSTGQLMSVITYSSQILMSLMMLSMIFMMMVISRAAAERVDEILQEKTTIENPDEPLTKVENGDIVFKGVNFSYDPHANRPCLADVDLHIRSGETVGIIGGTGSGKSTLVQLIPRLYEATEGSVEVAGHDVRAYDMTALRNSVAMVLQKNVLFAGTIKENLRWGNENATDEEMAEACRLAQADEFIRSFPDGYDTHIEQGGTNVSGGQRQRLCIARALLKKPKILIMDDSTSAVDTATDAKLRAAMRSYIPDTTKLIIAQRVASVQEADRIIVMEGGRINGIGTHEELLATNAIYQEVYNSQVKGGGDFDENN